MTPSPVLVDQTSTAVPTAIIGPVLVLMGAMTFYRIAVVGDRRPTSTAANWYGAWIIVYATTRVPEVQSLLLSIPGMTYVDVRTLGSSADLAAAISLLLLAVRWRSPSGVARRASLPIAVTGWAVGTALLFWLAQPARLEAIAIEEVGGWRAAVYATIYSGVFIPAEALIVVTLVQMSRDGLASRGRRALAGVLMAAIAVSAVSLSTRIIGAWLAAANLHTPLSEFRTAAGNDVAFYMSILWLIPAALPLVVADLRRRMGFDRSLSSEIEALRPLWSAVTAAAPQYQLRAGEGLPSDVERLHRMRIEIEDCGLALARRLPANTQWPASPEGRADLLRQASTLEPATTGVAPAWLSDESAVDEVAEAWRRLGAVQDRKSGTHAADKASMTAGIAGGDVLDAKVAGLNQQ